MSGLDRRKLARVLGMLGSAHDGEIVAAARNAHAIIRRAGMTWEEVLQPPIRALQRRSTGDVVIAIDECLGCSDLATEWEERFLLSLRRVRRLSDRQREVLDDILGKIRQDE